MAAGCGFQLRGDPVVGIRSLHVSSVTPSNIATEVRRSLAASRTQVMPTPVGAEAHLRVLEEVREKNVATITGTGRVHEYELRLVVRYQLTVPGREIPLIAPTEAIARRLISYSETAPTAKEAEEQLLFKDMQADLAARILRHVAVARREL